MEYDKNRWPHRDLALGDRGKDVRQLQVAMNHCLKSKQLNLRARTDGYCGPATVYTFQRVVSHLDLGSKMTKGNQRLVRWPWLRILFKLVTAPLA